MKGVVSLLFPLLILFVTISAAQVIDSFDDGDFSSNPAWSGDTSEWRIVTKSSSGPNTTGSNTLRLAVPSGSGTSYLSTQRAGSWGNSQSWGFWLGRRSDSAGTSSNYSVVWLYANEGTLKSATVDGYCVAFGDSVDNDEIRLQRVVDGAATDILSSSQAVPNKLSDISFLVRVVRTQDSLWTLYTSVLPTTNGDGAPATTPPSTVNTSENQGSVMDSTYTSFNDGYFGFMAIHLGGATSRTGAEFDQLYFDTSSDSSLPVGLSQFAAAVSADGVHLSWRIEVEVNNVGFHVYRRDRGTGEALRLTTDLLPGAGNSALSQDYSFIDRTAMADHGYTYWIEDVDLEGVAMRSRSVAVLLPRRDRLIPQFRLLQNYPNPFNPETWIPFELPKALPVTLQVCDLQGRNVRTIGVGLGAEGSHFTPQQTIYWDGRDQQGELVSSGVYIYTLSSGGFSQTRRMVVLK